MAVERDFKIKTGVLTRLCKEYNSYVKEEETQKSRIEKMKHEGRDEHDIRKQIEVLQETQSMIPDCKKRIEKAKYDLETMINKHKEMNLEEIKAAEEAVKQAESI